MRRKKHALQSEPHINMDIYIYMGNQSTWNRSRIWNFRIEIRIGFGFGFGFGYGYIPGESGYWNRSRIWNFRIGIGVMGIGIIYGYINLGNQRTWNRSRIWNFIIGIGIGIRIRIGKRYLDTHPLYPACLVGERGEAGYMWSPEVALLAKPLGEEGAGGDVARPCPTRPGECTPPTLYISTSIHYTYSMIVIKRFKYTYISMY